MANDRAGGAGLRFAEYLVEGTMNARVFLIAATMPFIVACYDSTRYIDADAGEEEVATPEDPSWEPCELIGDHDTVGNDYVIQIRNPGCDSTICLYYQGDTFCTHHCERDSDCRDVGAGRCAFMITVGEPDLVGTYFVISEY